MAGEQALTGLFGNPDAMFKAGIYQKNIDPLSKITPYLVTIFSTDTCSVVRGMMTNPLSFNVDAKWDATDIISSVTSNGALGKLYEFSTSVLGAAGVANPSNLGVSSRKIYSSSGYLNITVEFRVVDWQGTGAPKDSAYLLSTMCLPKSNKNMSLTEFVGFLGKYVIDKSGNVLRLLTDKFGMSTEDATKVADFVTKGADAALDIAGGAAKAVTKSVEEGIKSIAPTLAKGTFSLVDDPQFFVLASSPLPVKVTIGNYFEHNDMVVEGVKTDFSKECTSNGPLYADFSVSLSSRQTILLNEGADKPSLGLKTGSVKRVSRKALARG